MQQVLKDPELRKVFSEYMLDAARADDGTHNAAYYAAANAAGQYQLGFDQHDEHEP
ncbi:MAG: hypothetical protein ACR2F6_01750 [Mycobacteriales bacterium]